jgi:fibronectin-binding autotransporter adhesin
MGRKPVPTSADAVTIANGVTVTVDVSNAAASSLEIGKGTGGCTGAGTLQFNSGSQLTVGGNVIVGDTGGAGAAGSLVMTSGGTLKVAGSFTLTAAKSTFTRGTGTIEYSASAAQTVTATTYNNLATSGSNTKTLAGFITVKDLTIGASTTLAAGGNNIDINGNWNNNETFTASAGQIVTFNGVTQSISGSSATAFQVLAIGFGTITANTAPTAATFNMLGAGSVAGRYIQTTGAIVQVLLQEAFIRTVLMNGEQVEG